MSDHSASPSLASAPAKTPKSVRFANDPPSHTGSRSATLFSLDDDDDETEEGRYGAPYSAPSTSSTTPQGGKVRGAYGLKSTIPSREAEFDAASDTLSDEEGGESISAIDGGPLLDRSSSRSGLASSPRRDRSLPLPLPSSLRQSIDGFGGNISELRRNVMEGIEGVSHAAGINITTDELPDWLKRGAGVFDATTNMANSILGAGIVGLPYSMRQSGFVAGVILLVGLAMLTDWTIRLIILNSKLSGRTTYIEIMEHCFGKHGKAAVSIFQFAFAFGGMCAFCVVIGDTIPHVLAAMFPSLAPGASFFSFLASRTFVITFCTLLISYPLSLYRSIENLSKASAVALVSMVLIVGTVIVRGPAMPAELKGDPSLRFTIVNPTHLVSSISVISFAFVCHHNSLLIYTSLKEPSMDKFGKVTHYSTAIACAALTAMSIAGYWTFEEKTLGNVLNNFPENDTFVNIARFAFGVNMFTTFPLEAFVCREVIETYFFANEFSSRLHIIITTSLVVASLIVSLLTCDLGIVLELTGGLSATALAFIFPAACFLKLSAEGEGKALRVAVGRSRDGSAPATSTRSRAPRSGGGSGYEAVPSDVLAEDRDSHDLESSRSGPQQGHEYEDDEQDISIEDVELPLRPGAGVRRKQSPADDHSSRESEYQGGSSGGLFGRALGSSSDSASAYTSFLSHLAFWKRGTRTLAAACALFGTVVLIISVGQALVELFSGAGRGAVHSC